VDGFETITLSAGPLEAAFAPSIGMAGVPDWIALVESTGTKIKIISGYGSGGDLNIAMERGETQGRGNFYSGFEAVRPDWLRDDKIRILLTLGPKNPKTAPSTWFMRVRGEKGTLAACRSWR
jgi:hypothetical protein